MASQTAIRPPPPQTWYPYEGNLRTARRFKQLLKALGLADHFRTSANFPVRLHSREPVGRNGCYQFMRIVAITMRPIGLADWGSYPPAMLTNGGCLSNTFWALSATLNPENAPSDNASPMS